MRYTIEVDERGKVKRVKQGKSVFYYVDDKADNKTTLVTKDWLLENERFVTNLSISKTYPYVVNDRYEKAIKVIKNDIRQKIANNRFDARGTYDLVLLNPLMLVYKLPANPTVTTCWDYIKSLEEYVVGVYTDCLDQAISEEMGRGKNVYMKKDGAQRWVFSSTAPMSEEHENAQKITSAIEVISNI